MIKTKRKSLFLIIALILLVLFLCIPVNAGLLANYTSAYWYTSLVHPDIGKLHVNVTELNYIDYITVHVQGMEINDWNAGMVCNDVLADTTPVDIKYAGDTYGHGILEWSCDYFPPAWPNEYSSPADIILTITDFDSGGLSGILTLDLINTSIMSPYPTTLGTYQDANNFHVSFGEATNQGSTFSSCSVSQFLVYGIGSPYVDFSYTINGNTPRTVNFVDTSGGGFTPVYYGWWFGDGNSYNGIESIIQHTYTSLGTYDVNHAATDFDSFSGWMNKTISLTSVSNGGYSLSVSPSTITYGNPTNVILSSDHSFNDVSVVSYYTQDSVNFESFTLFRSYFNNYDGTWSKTNTSSTPYLPTNDNPFSFSYSPSTYGNKTISAYVYNRTGIYPTQYLALIGSPSTILYVVSPAINPLVNMYLYAYDVYTGQHLSNVTLTLTDYTLGGVTRTWNNVNYEQNVVMNAYDYANLTASKEGYSDGFMPFTVPLATGNKDNPNNPPLMSQFVGTPLLPSYIGSSATNGTLIVTAIDSITKQPISNFKVSISPINVLRTSDNLGNQLIILIPYDTALYATCSATGYNSQSEFTGVYHPSVLKKLEFELVKIVPTITPTKTPTPITTFTTRPTITTTAGGIIKNGTFCQYPEDVVTSIYYFFCTMGVNVTAAGIIIACLIMVFFACLLGVLSQHALGFLVGALIGFIMSIGLGLIPFWILLGMLGLGILLGILILLKSG